MRVFNLGGDLRKQEGRNRESGTAKEEKPLKWNMNIGKIKHHYNIFIHVYHFHSFNRISKAVSRL